MGRLVYAVTLHEAHAHMGLRCRMGPCMPHGFGSDIALCSHGIRASQPQKYTKAHKRAQEKQKVNAANLEWRQFDAGSAFGHEASLAVDVR